MSRYRPYQGLRHSFSWVTIVVLDRLLRRHMKTITCTIILTLVMSIASAATAQSLTRQQQNAVRAANAYLQMGGFSRDGLIAQLSSPYGDQFDAADARAAVDSMTVDWNRQAAISAERYMSMMGFSCRGLIDQLASSHGDQFTRAQAEHGARAAGAC
jgi:hypothetical protein